MTKQIRNYHFLSFSVLFIGVALTRFACVIALYKITGSPTGLVASLIITFLPQIASGLFATNIMGKADLKKTIVFLTACHAILTLFMIAAFAYKLPLVIYALLFAKGFIFGVIDPTFKTLLASTSQYGGDIRKRFAFRQGLIFGAGIVANGLGAAWLEWGGVSVILLIESVVVLQSAFTLNILLGSRDARESSTPSSGWNIFNQIKEICIHPWLRVLFLRSVSDGVSIVAVGVMLINTYQLSPAKAGFFSSMIGIAAATCMFLVPFTGASKWGARQSSLLNGGFLSLCGLILAFACASIELYYFVLLYILATPPYCLADMNIQSMPFINAPQKSDQLAGLQNVTIAIGEIIGMFLLAGLTSFKIPSLYGLAMLVFLGGAGLTSILIREPAYA